MKILNTVEVSNGGLGFILLVLAIVSLCYTLKMFDEQYGILGIIMMFLTAILVVCAIVQFKAPARTQYIVAFDENYTVNELIENYEIVDQRGNLLIVEEKSE